MKIIDKVQACTKQGSPFFSFEFFPPKTDEGIDNLFERMDGMVSYGPTFCDITWGAGGSTADLTLDIADRMQNEINIECMMHLTCTNMPESKLKEALEALMKFGVRNILALRGDPPHGKEKFEALEDGFSCALDLVKYIRKETGNHFGICVSGYPEAHPDAIVEDKEQMEKNYWSDIHYLKEKLDAGADFVITQLFYDTDIFIKWVKDCRSVGITAPIIPGIMPIMAYGGFNRMTSFCKTYVPQEIKDKVESLKDDDAALKEYGIQLAVQMCKQILDADVSPGVHVYSLNQDKSAVAILERLKLLSTESPPRALPFRPRTKAPTEGVRPVYWSNRDKSYLARTVHWKHYPSQRWSEVRHEALAPPPATLMNYTSRSEKRLAKALDSWGAPSTVDALKASFSKFVKGEIKSFPWAQTGLPRQAAGLADQLAKLVSAGYLPINALMQVNGKQSSDGVHGWGGPGGYVYQKGYVEFFCSPESFHAFQERVKSLDSLSYMATNSSGDFHADVPSTSAVSWGVFPGKEIMQPLVTCAASFKSWSSEAFELWSSEWAAIAAEHLDSVKLLKEVKDTWYLVSLLENDYVSGDIFRIAD